MFGDVIHLHAGQANGQQRVGLDQLGGYLDTCGGPCQDNPYCVSTSGTTNRDRGSGSWRILLTEGGQGGGHVNYGQDVHLQNGFNNWSGGYLDTRGSEGGYLCVSAHVTDVRPSGDDANGGILSHPPHLTASAARRRFRPFGRQQPNHGRVQGEPLTRNLTSGCRLYMSEKTTMLLREAELYDGQFSGVNGDVIIY
jgi:hypothetical protein